MSSTLQAPSRMVHDAHRRLQHLYEISNLLTDFRGAQTTLSAVVALLRETLPVRTAIFVLKLQGTLRSVAWRDEDVAAAELEAAQARAFSAYDYLTHARAARIDRAGGSATPDFRRQHSAHDSNIYCLTLPLVVGHHAIFGVLELESSEPSTESDLVYVNAIVNQIAIALDRQAAIDAKLAAMDAAKAAAEAQRDAAEALQRLTRMQLEFTNALTSSLGEGLLAMDLKERITFMNPAVEHLLGCTRQDALGKRIQEVLRLQRVNGDPIADEEHIARAAILGAGSVRTEDYVLACGPAAGLPISCIATGLEQGGHVVGAVLVLQDITERRRTESALREIDHRKDEFLATLAHELRNPLAALAAAAQLLLKEEQKPAVAAAARDALHRQVDHMARLLDDLLEISRITHGRIQLRIERLDVAQIIADAVESVRPMLAAKAHELVVDMPDAPVSIEGDRLRLIQVLSNLLTNAVKYTDPGGKIQVAMLREDRSIFIRVTDSGIGISAGMLPNVFTMFAQVKSALDRSEGGLGIGLALAKSLVELHGGALTAHSEGLGRGSEFTVSLPLTQSQSHAPPQPAVPTEPRRVREMATRRILIADDNRDTADALALLLEQEGNEVRKAYDGEEAFGVAASFQPSLVLLDIGMPRMNGYEVARRIRAESWGRQMTLIAFTGWGQAEDKRVASVAGFDHHLTKPVTLEMLRGVVRGIVRHVAP